MKIILFFFIYITMILLINSNFTDAQYMSAPRPMGDYILRSCIASVVLMKNYRKSQIPPLNTSNDNSMTLGDNFTNKKSVSTNSNTAFMQRNPIWRVQDKITADTPLKTLDIKKGRMRDLIFIKKDRFPEILTSHYHDDQKDNDAKIIVIKSIVNHDDS